jgi:hypothetical protein
MDGRGKDEKQERGNGLYLSSKEGLVLLPRPQVTQKSRVEGSESHSTPSD